ncbi:MAG: ribulose-phosphate 3-epimerase [Chloroflexi bacterium]|nr:ribulose-phosphate 3-epimerase [Chloroflexota bacterium]
MNRPIRLVPAILTEDPKTLETMIRLAETFTDYVQVDVMDGQFVPSRSISWADMEGLPVKLKWEVHLMVQHPEEYLAGFRKAGAQRAIFHYEAGQSPRKVIATARTLGLEAGLAVNPETPVSAILSLVDELDSVLFLSVNPGFYGSQFIPEVMTKVAELRRLRPEIEIGIDGGIKEANITQVAKSGVNVIYVGSAVFLQPQPAESYRRLLALAQGS